MIEENLENSKAWFRRGEAYFCLNDWDNAKADFEKTVQLDQDNKAAKNKVRVSVFFRIWDGMGWDGMGWDRMGWDGTGRDGTGRDGTGWG